MKIVIDYRNYTNNQTFLQKNNYRNKSAILT